MLVLRYALVQASAEVEAEQLGVSVDQGIMIGNVERGSAAAKAGLQGSNGNAVGDVIVAIDGHEVKTFDDLAGYLDTKNPGDTVTFDIVRGTQHMNVNFKLDAWTS